MAVQADCIAVAGCAEAAYQMYIERIGKPPAPMVADFRSQIAEGKVYVLEQYPLSQEQPLLGFVVCFKSNARHAESVRSTTRENKGTKKDNCAKAQTYFLENIAVNPHSQRAGHGNRLIKHVFALATDNNCSAVELYTNEMMTENIAWYKKLGFSEINRVFEDGFNRVYMRLAL